MRDKKFGLEKIFWASAQYKEIDEFYFQIHDGIANIIDSNNILIKQNLSKLEFSA